MKQISVKSEISSRANFVLLTGSSLLAVLALGPGWYADDVLAPFSLALFILFLGMSSRSISII